MQQVGKRNAKHKEPISRESGVMEQGWQGRA